MHRKQAFKGFLSIWKGQSEGSKRTHTAPPHRREKKAERRFNNIMYMDTISCGIDLIQLRKKTTYMFAMKQQGSTLCLIT